ncbi:TPA: hypothetical protein N0F65_012634 [Lagenidium giganteum]|uniref:Uncharacterized protein n=1 Tax=Lagenidium giganteum TaxID=4803 RepID=A0AAV2YFA1_9STRA|nr:TPA: hypothetical protein N0F65_012634 [Lagenidium giganteum]
MEMAAKGESRPKHLPQPHAVDDDDDAAERTKNEGEEETITVMAHVRDKMIPVHCGFGTQQVLWLGHVAIARFDEVQQRGWLELGVPVKMVKDGKEELRMADIICDVLQNHSHVYITTSLDPTSHNHPG